MGQSSTVLITVQLKNNVTLDLRRYPIYPWRLPNSHLKKRTCLNMSLVLAVTVGIGIFLPLESQRML